MLARLTEPQEGCRDPSVGQRWQALLAVSQAIFSQRDLSALFHDLADRLHSLVRFDYLALTLHEATSNTLRLHVLEPKGPISLLTPRDDPVDGSAAGLVWQSQQPLVISNVAEQSRWPELSERAQALGIQSLCELPLTTARRPVGTLVFACKEPSAYDPADVDFLRHVANQVALAVENALAFQELAALRDELTVRGRQHVALLGVSEAIVSHRDLPSLFRDLAGRLQEFLRFDYIVLVLHDAATSTMRLHLAAVRCEPAPPAPEIILPLEDDPAALVWETQQPLILDSVSELSRWPRLWERVQPYGVQSLCLLPLTTARRRLGTLNFSCQQPSAYGGADVGFLQHLANQVAVVVENALDFQELTALKDQLTQEKAYLEEEVRTENFKEMVTVSASLRGVLKKVETVAPTDSTVLICGETGTGKELVARALHDLSLRRQRPLAKLNCAAIPMGLLESELFGHERGAFTGAVSQKVGRFELADKGTLFLDEVGDIPPELQPKLLRVLQEQEFERLGGTKTIKVDGRLVAATNRDLAKMVAEGRFRSDLYYRLNVFPIVLPPLRERPEAIPPLVRHFTQKFARRMGRRIETVPSAVMDALVRYPWPGNVRELQNVIERAVILSPGRSLQVPLSELQPVTMQTPVKATAAVTLADAEREHILDILHETGWVLGGPKGAAARLGMKRSTLQWKMKKLGISRLG